MNNYHPTFRSEFAIVPTIARVLAVIGFCLVQIALLVLVPRYVHGPDLPPHHALTLISFFAGLLFATFILMVGYVNADSKRRGMNSVLWTLLVIFIPKAIGFLAYFLLRKPLLTDAQAACPKCGTGMGPDFRFCPKCGYAISPVCVQCGRAISREFMCCPYCGRATAPAASPVSPAPAS